MCMCVCMCVCVCARAVARAMRGIREDRFMRWGEWEIMQVRVLQAKVSVFVCVCLYVCICMYSICKLECRRLSVLCVCVCVSVCVYICVAYAS